MCRDVGGGEAGREWGWGGGQGIWDDSQDANLRFCAPWICAVS